MSRTQKGGKGCGFEYWGRQQIGLDRDKSFDRLRDPGKENKTLLHKVDRRKTKQDLGLFTNLAERVLNEAKGQ